MFKQAADDFSTINGAGHRMVHAAMEKSLWCLYRQSEVVPGSESTDLLVKFGAHYELLRGALRNADPDVVLRVDVLRGEALTRLVALGRYIRVDESDRAPMKDTLSMAEPAGMSAWRVKSPHVGATTRRRWSR